jgi:hypothetical protein
LHSLIIDVFYFSHLLVLGISNQAKSKLLKENGSKNSKKVNDILKRLTSYTNQKSVTIDESKSKTKLNSSTDSSGDSNNSESESDGEVDDDTQHQGHESSDISENEEDDINDEDDEDDLSDVKPAPVQQIRQYQINCIKSLDSTDTCDSDDSDSLFSIIRHKPKQQPTTSNLVSTIATDTQEPTKKHFKKKQRVKNNENKFESSEYESDDELKLPAKRIKIEKQLSRGKSSLCFFNLEIYLIDRFCVVPSLNL